MDDIIFLGNARCYHTMDWYRSAKDVCYPRNVLLVTELIESEGHVRLINEDDKVINLYNVDWLLMRRQSKLGNYWRNLIRFILLPLQAIRLLKFARSKPNATYHAHTMYYMLLSWLAGLRFIGTPQGSEILVRPDRSRVYRYFAVKALSAAKHITVDSVNMQNKIVQLCGIQSYVIQNGIDVTAISHFVETASHRNRIVSIRGFTPLYRIDEICKARAHSLKKPPLTFFYPYWEDEYKQKVSERFRADDIDLGRLARTRMYELLASTLLAISIPESDSSPRSVYEAIFCGCCVAVTYSSWVEALPVCMKTRIIIVQLDDYAWFDKAILHAEAIAAIPYKPSDAALDLFDQKRSMQIVAEKLYCFQGAKVKKDAC